MTSVTRQIVESNPDREREEFLAEQKRIHEHNKALIADGNLVDPDARLLLEKIEYILKYLPIIIGDGGRWAFQNLKYDILAGKFRTGYLPPYDGTE